MKKTAKKIFITIGDPRGIGPEIICKSIRDIMCSDLKHKFVPVVIGEKGILNEWFGNEIEYTKLSKPGMISGYGMDTSGHPGRDSLENIKKAIDFCVNDESSAMVTGPVEKEIISKVKKDFIGHTEYLAEMTGISAVVMSFISEKIKMSLLTTHLSLNEVSSKIYIDSIREHVNIVRRELIRRFEIKVPRIVLCSLNPHGGENGLFGMEEVDIMLPAAEQLRREGTDIAGPLGACEALRGCIDGLYDFIVSPYHDQILTAVKLFLGPTVNLTMGLPFVRTSPDHGPAIDIAGKDKADYSSMKAAIELAVTIR